MIAKGNTHGHGAKLAEYMEQGKDGERAELWDLRGFEATNLKDAFRDVQIMAGATKCEQPFFHVQLRNREGEKLTRQQWEHAADRIERMLGLADQPRAIAFHTYEHNNDEHMHVAWSRIDQDTLTAKPLPFFKKRLKEISRELEVEFGLMPVSSERNSPIKFAPTKAQDEQARRLGVDIDEIQNSIRACYERSDCGVSFQAALEGEGMTLSQGDRRGYVVIDQEGGIHALSKRILDVSAARIRDRLSDLPPAELPTVDQARSCIPGLQHDTMRDLKQELAQVVKLIDRAEHEQDMHDLKAELAEIDGLIAAADPETLRRARESLELAEQTQQLIDHYFPDQSRSLIDTFFPGQPAATPERSTDPQQQQAPPLWDRDRDDNAWQEAVMNAAIENEKIERRFLEPKKTQTGGSRKKEMVADTERIPLIGPELGRTAGEIRLAYSLTNTGQEFANALEDRGLILARMTEADAERLNRWEAQRLKEWQALAPNKTGATIDPWMAERGGVEMLTPALRESAERSYDAWQGDKKRYDLADYVSYVQEKDEERKQNLLGQEEPVQKKKEKYKADELVVVDQFGGVHQLTYKNAGDGLDDRTEHLKGIERAPLFSVTAAESVMKNVQQHRREEKQQEWQQKRDDANLPWSEKHWPINPPAPTHHSWAAFGKAGEEATIDTRTEGLKGAEALIWTAWRESDSAKAFAAALDDKGIMFAVVTSEEAFRSHKEADFAKEIGRYTPRFKEGEIVVVTEPRPEYRRNDEIVMPGRVQKLNQSLAYKFVKELDNRSELQGIDATIEASDQRAQQRSADRLETTLERATRYRSGSRKVEQRNGTVPDGALDRTPIRTLGKVFDVASDIFESIFAPKLTPEQERVGQEAKLKREAEAENTIDFSRYTAELAEQHRRQESERDPARHREPDGRER